MNLYYAQWGIVQCLQWCIYFKIQCSTSECNIAVWNVLQYNAHLYSVFCYLGSGSTKHFHTYFLLITDIQISIWSDSYSCQAIEATNMVAKDRDIWFFNGPAAETGVTYSQSRLGYTLSTWMSLMRHISVLNIKQWCVSSCFFLHSHTLVSWVWRHFLILCLTASCGCSSLWRWSYLNFLQYNNSQN